MKPDVILSWPRNCDFPVWRENLHQTRNLYDRVIVVFTETWHGPNFRDFVRAQLIKDDVLVLESPRPKSEQDWRNVAVNFALQYARADWLWFTEQDFFPREGFWPEVQQIVSSTGDAIGILSGERIHPACLFIERSVLARTHKDFGIIKDKGDHFCRIQDDLMALKSQGVETLYIEEKYYEHLNGLSHNMRLIFEDELPNHAVERFNEYLKDSLKVTVGIDDFYRMKCREYLTRIGESTA